MSKYKGLFTFDVDNHRFIPVGQADGIISNKYNQEPKEEPKEWWFIDCSGFIKHGEGLFTEKSYIKDIQAIGNYFETKEEAEKAVEKLKALKRLEDKGLKVIEWVAGLGDDNYKIGEVMVGFDIDGVYDGNVPDDTEKDLDLLFGGEE